jgi:hypothetical protein
MLKALCIAIGLGLVPQCCWALFADFEDLPPSGSYPALTTFTSEGLSFHLSPAYPATCCALVTNNQQSGGTGQDLSLPLKVGVALQLPVPARKVNFLFGDYNGQDTGIVVNGVASAKGLAFAPLAGQTIAGVSVTVDPFGTIGRGRLTLIGPIKSLVIGGTELYIDNVSVTLPEPSAAALLVIGCVSCLAIAEPKTGRAHLSHCIVA